jgi:choice-of-anchor B domain-containing protein
MRDPFRRSVRAAFFATLLCLLAPLSAHAQVQRNVTLLSHLQQYPEYSACWSYVHSDGREYVVINALRGASIVRLTDPANPVEVAFIPLVEDFWHEVKQYRNYLYITSDGFFQNGHKALQIIDMRDPDRPRRANGFNPDLGFIHTVSVDEDRGLLFLNGMPPEEHAHTDAALREIKFELDQGLRHGTHSFGSMHIYSLADPEHPAELAVYHEYVHDFHVRGTRGYASLIFDGQLAVLDLTDPANPVEITRWETPNGFTHSAWTSEDGRYLYVCDETTGPNSLSVYDITDIMNPRLTYLHQDLIEDIPHNPRVKGNVLYVAHYSAGVRVWDITNPAWPVESGWYDTFQGIGGGFSGVWEVAPYYPSGIFAASDINTGLYVFRSAPKNYGIVRGTVREASNGPPIAGVKVTAQPGGRTFTTHTDGTFAFALDPGSYTFTFSLFRFDNEIRSVNNVTVGSDRTLSVSMRRTPTGTIQGVVSSSGSPLGGAELTLDGFEKFFNAAVSNNAGAYQIPAVPIGTYTVRCLRAGFVPAAQTVSVSSGQATVANFPLTAAAYYDDAETDRGWTLSALDDFSERGGFWIRAVPLPSVLFTGQVVQTGADHTPAPGTMCFVTGNFPDPRFVFNEVVFQGKVTLTSPVVSLAGLSDPRVGFWAWYTNLLEDLGDTPDDVMLVQLSGDGGATWVTAHTQAQNTRGWRYLEVRVRDWLPTAANVRMKVIVIEAGLPHLNEAALDDFAVYSGGAGPAPAARLVSAQPAAREAPVAFRGLSPLPSRGTVRAALELRQPTEVRADVFDVRGRLVRSLRPGVLGAGAQRITWDGRASDGTPSGSGVYWMRLRAADLEKTLKVVLAR